MRAVRSFGEFLGDGTVKLQIINRPRAEFLLKESEQNYSYLLLLLEKMGINDLNANDYVKKCYDILMELVRAKMLLMGYNSSGYGAHEAEVAYLRVLGFIEKDVQFADQMRFFRNGMLYYGTIIDKEYAEKVIVFTKSNYKKLKILISLK